MYQPLAVPTIFNVLLEDAGDVTRLPNPTICTAADEVLTESVWFVATRNSYVRPAAAVGRVSV